MSGVTGWVMPARHAHVPGPACMANRFRRRCRSCTEPYGPCGNLTPSSIWDLTVTPAQPGLARPGSVLTALTPGPVFFFHPFTCVSRCRTPCGTSFTFYSTWLFSLNLIAFTHDYSHGLSHHCVTREKGLRAWGMVRCHARGRCGRELIGAWSRGLVSVSAPAYVLDGHLFVV
jgi:hypothetical protein